MSVWGILRNLGLVISFFKSFSNMVKGVAVSKQMPPKESMKELLDRAEALLDSGAIDIPGVDEKAVSEALKQIEEQLCG